MPTRPDTHTGKTTPCPLDTTFTATLQQSQNKGGWKATGRGSQANFHRQCGR